MGDLRGKTVLVTGGVGFLGKALCAELQGYQPARLITPRKAQYDLTEQAAVRKMLDEQRPEVIIHLAAVVGGIGANRLNPGRYFYENAIMGIMLMEEARKRSVEKFVTVGTICAYPKHTPVPFREDDLWLGYPEETNAPYGIAKKSLLVQAQAYRQQYDFRAISLLPVNLYGPGDNFDPTLSHVVPALIKKVVEAQALHQPFIEVWGTGSASREFLYVDDAARGIAMAADQYDDADPCNLGSGREITIKALAELICKLCGYQGELRWDTSKPDGQPRRCLDTTRARERFGFVAETEFETGLRNTIAWYRQQRSVAKAA